MKLLSKTHYLQYLRCPKLFWLAVNCPSALPAPSEAEKARMAEGRKVEELARRLLEGTLIEHGDGLETAIRQSIDVLSAPCCGDVFFRPVVRYGRMVAEIDMIFVTREGKLDIHEVKSGTEITEDHLHDVAFQRWVAEKAGLPMGECAVVAVRSDYVRQGPVDVTKLYRIMDVTWQMEKHLAAVEVNVDEALRIMDSPECPNPHIGQHCKDCPFVESPDGCWREIHAEPDNIFTLYRLPAKRAWDWYGQGYLRSRDIPADYPLTDSQRIQIKAEATGEPHVDRGQVAAFYNRLEFPLYFLDFETFASPIPLIDNTSPYQAVPFQFSLHTLEKSLDEEPRHVSWIWDAGEGDPREIMLGRLKDLLGDKGSIIAYNATFEKAVLKKAVALHPAYADWLKGILPRFLDLLVPFRNFQLYHPAQHGSCSLKSVLPAWTGKGYSGMAISGGEQAGREYVRVMFGRGITAVEKEPLLRSLEAYCGLDTMAMVELLRVMDGVRGSKMQ